MNSHQLSGPVVVGIDGLSVALDAVRFAVAEAASRGASLRLVHVINPHPQPETVYGAPDVDADYGHMVLSQAAEARSLVESSAHPIAVVRHARPLLGGSVVVALGDADAPAPDPVVAEAFREASARVTDIEAVHTRSMTEVFEHAVAGPAGALHPESSMDVRLAPFAENYPDVRVATVYAEASAGSELVAMSCGAQLIVVGHQHGRACGSTLTELLRHANSPVMVVPHA